MKTVFFNVSAYNHQKTEKANAYKVKILEQQNELKKWLVKFKCTPSTEPSKLTATVVDIYSLNWEIDTKNASLFASKSKAKNTLKELKQIPPALIPKTKDANAQVLLMLDIKTKQEGYTNAQSIKALEQTFLNLFTQEKKLPYIKQLIDSQLQHVFLEGSLKANLLATNLFSPDLQHHLQQDSSDFCQMVEFMINAFKRGESVTVKAPNGETVFEPQEYIAKIYPKTTPDFKPVSVSYTIYPASYYDVATQGKYTEAMKQSGLFSIKIASKNDSKVVQMQTEKSVSGVAHAC